MTAPITPDERAEWRALADAATPGPWEASIDDLTDEINVVHDQEYRAWVAHTGMPGGPYAQESAEFIAAARTAVPRLLDALDTADAEVARLREEAAPVRPDRETIADVLMSDWHGEYTCECQTDRCPTLPCPTSTPSYVTAADAVLALWPGESRATVQAEALRDAADAVTEIDGRRDDAAARWLRARADRLEKGADRG